MKNYFHWKESYDLKQTNNSWMKTFAINECQKREVMHYFLVIKIMIAVVVYKRYTKRNIGCVLWDMDNSWIGSSIKSDVMRALLT